jgi:hypothetical protein
MYKNILIATDGLSLAARAVEHGVNLAKSLGAKVLLLTVTERFHVFALEADQLEETSDSFREHMQKQAERTLAEASAIAATWVSRPRRFKWRTMRPIGQSSAWPRITSATDRHGFAWTGRGLGSPSRERDHEGPCPLEHPGPGGAVMRSSPSPGWNSDRRAGR